MRKKPTKRNPLVLPTKRLGSRVIPNKKKQASKKACRTQQGGRNSSPCFFISKFLLAEGTGR